MRQGNDVGTQCRSAIYIYSDAQKKAADESKALYQKALVARGLDAITTEIGPSGEFYSPKITISDIWRRIPPAIAASAAPGCPVRSALA